MEAKQLAAHQSLPALQLLTQLHGEELLAQNYRSVVHYHALHFVQEQVQRHFHHQTKSQQAGQVTHHFQAVEPKQHGQEKSLKSMDCSPSTTAALAAHKIVLP